MTAERYYVKRPTGKVFGPFDKNAIQLMLKSNKLGFDAQVSKDKESWTMLSDIPDFAGSGAGGSNLPRSAGPPNLPRPAGGGDEDLPRSAQSDLPRSAGGADLPRSAGDGGSGGADLPRSAGPSNLPRPSGGGDADLPRSAQSDLPQSAQSDLPRSAQGTMLSSPGNLPQSAQSDLPRSAQSDLPRSAQSNLPQSSGGADLPRPAGDANLPASSGGANLPKSSPPGDLPRSAGSGLPASSGPANLPKPPPQPSSGPPQQPQQQQQETSEEDLFGGPMSMMDEDDEEDLFGAPSIEMEDDDEDDLFGAPSIEMEDDDEDDLFGSPAGHAEESDDLFGAPAGGGPQDDFDDEDDLFGGPAQGAQDFDDDEDDLFGAPGGGAGHDGGLDEDSLFDESADDDFLGGDQGFSFLDDGPSQGGAGDEWEDDLLGGDGGAGDSFEDDFLTGNAPPDTGAPGSSGYDSGGYDDFDENLDADRAPSMQAPGPSDDPFRPASRGIQQPQSSGINAQVTEQEASDEDSKRSKMVKFGLPIVAILVLGTLGLGVVRFLNDSTEQTQKTVQPVQQFTLDYETLYASNHAELRDIVSRSKKAKATPEVQGKLLLAEALMASLHKDEDVLKNAGARAQKLTSASQEEARLGRGAFAVAKGEHKEGRDLLEPLVERGGDIALFAHLFLGLADMHQIPEGSLASLEDSERLGSKNGGEPDPDDAPSDDEASPDEEAQAPADAQDDEEAASDEDEEDDAEAETPPTSAEGEVEEEPIELGGETKALATSAIAHFDAAMKQSKTRPAYWKGRLQERRRKTDAALKAYKTSLEGSEDFVPAHVALGRLLYERGELNGASKHLEKVINELTALAHNEDKAAALHYMGAVYSARSQSQLAIDNYTKALTADASRKDTLRALAEEYERAQQYKEALNFFRTNETLGQSDPEVMLGIVRAHIGLKEWAQAIAQLEIGEKKFPTDARFPYYLGELNRRRGSFYEAQKALKRAVEIDPSLLMAHAMLAQLAWRTDKDAEAGEEHITKIVERPEEIEARVAVEVAEFYRMIKDADTAKQWYRAAIKKDPNFWSARLPLSRLLLEQGQTEKALDLLERSRQEGVKDVRLSAYLADAYRQSKLYDKAIDEINKVIEKVPKKKNKERAEYVFIRGRIYFDRGNYETALEDFNEAYTLDTRYHDAYFYVGRTKLAQDDASTALKIFRHVLDYQPNNGEYRFFMGQVLEGEKRLTQALEEYRKVTEVDPGYGVRNPRVYIARGRLLSRLGYSAEGKEDIRRALKLAPEMEEALVAMGEANFRDKQYDSAITYFTKALNKNPKYADAQHKLGMAHVYTENTRQGASHLQLAIKYGYDNPDIFRTLGYLYRQLNQRGQACDAFKKFLELALTKEVPLGTAKEVRRQGEELNCNW